jgi:hypothetical protein
MPLHAGIEKYTIVSTMELVQWHKRPGQLVGTTRACHVLVVCCDEYVISAKGYLGSVCVLLLVYHYIQGSICPSRYGLITSSFVSI